MFDLRPMTVTGLSLFGLLVSFNPALAFLAYVSNEKGNTISVVDTDKMETVATIKTGQRPRGIEVTRDGKFVLVALGDDDKIQVFDTRTRDDAGDLPSGADPEQFTLDPAGKFLYVANENDSMVTIIDMAKRAAIGQISVGTEPEGMAVSPDSKVLICTSETTSMVHFIDTASREVVDNLLVGSRPRYSEFKSDGSELWVTSEIGGTLAIIDPATRQLKQTVTFEIPGLRSEAIQPVGINITKDGKLGFIDLGACQSGGRGRWRYPRCLEIPAGRAARLAWRLYARRKIPAGRKWRLKRRLGHRRRSSESDKIHSGWRIALGYCLRAELRRRSIHAGTRAGEAQIRSFASHGRDSRRSISAGSTRDGCRSTGRCRAAQPSCID